MGIAQVHGNCDSGGTNPIYAGSYTGTGTGTKTLTIPAEANLVIIIGGGFRMTMHRGDSFAIAMGFSGTSTGSTNLLYIGKANLTWASGSVKLSANDCIVIDGNYGTSYGSADYRLSMNESKKTYHYYAFCE